MRLQENLPASFIAAQFTLNNDLSGGTIKFEPKVAERLFASHQLLTKFRKAFAKREPDCKIAVDVPRFLHGNLTGHTPTEVACWIIPGTDSMLFVDAQGNVYARLHLGGNIYPYELYMLPMYWLQQLMKGLEQLLGSQRS